MAQVLKLNSADPTIHVKAYGGIQITGVEQAEITCDIDSHDLVTMVEERGPCLCDCQFLMQYRYPGWRSASN